MKFRNQVHFVADIPEFSAALDKLGAMPITRTFLDKRRTQVQVYLPDLNVGW